jgi:FlaA1/EpsC-like NDP-sugar epimerase
MTGVLNSKNMRLTALVYDMAMAGLAMYAALILRLGTFEGLDKYSLVGTFNGLDDYNLVFGASLPFVVAAGASLLILGTYRTSWRHASTTDLTNIVKAATLAVLIYMPICFVVNRLDLIPRTSIVLAWMVFLLLMAGSRIGYRLFREGHLFFERHPMAPGQVPILIVGGGVDAKILLLSLEDHASEYYPVGVLDNSDELADPSDESGIAARITIEQLPRALASIYTREAYTRKELEEAKRFLPAHADDPRHDNSARITRLRRRHLGRKKRFPSKSFARLRPI